MLGEQTLTEVLDSGRVRVESEGWLHRKQVVFSIARHEAGRLIKPHVSLAQASPRKQEDGMKEKKALINITEGLKMRPEYSHDGITWCAGKWVKGNGVFYLDLGMGTFRYLRVVFSARFKPKHK